MGVRPAKSNFVYKLFFERITLARLRFAPFFLTCTEVFHEQYAPRSPQITRDPT